MLRTIRRGGACALTLGASIARRTLGAAAIAALLWLPAQTVNAAFIGLGQAGNYSIFAVSNSQWQMNNSVIAGPMAAGPGVTYNWSGSGGPYGGPIYYQTG